MDDETPLQRFRASRLLWAAYGDTCKQALARNRSEDLVAHMKRTIRRYGTEEAKAQLAEAEREVAERLKRKHQGRPPKTT